MKLRGFLILFSPIFFILFIGLPAQRKEFNFGLISIEQGLSQSTVFSIAQDKRGFMWFGTNDGLNKYDGYKMTVFKPDPGDPNSLCGNRVFSIFEDSGGDLWIGTDGGLNKFIREKEIFKHYTFDGKNSNSIPDNHVTCIKEDKDGFLWIGTNNGLAKFDKKKNSFTVFKNSRGDKFSLSNNFVWAIHNDKDGFLWIGTDSLLNKLDKKTGKFYRFNFAGNEPKRIARNTIFAICEDNNNCLWIATRSGLNIFDKKKETFTRVQNAPQNPNSLNQDNIYSLLIDKSKNLWVGTLGGGLNRLERNNSPADKKKRYEFIHYTHDSRFPSSLSNNYVWSLFEDKAGALWVGTDIGLNKYDPLLEKFIVYRNNPFSQNSLCGNVVTSILEDRTGLLWIGTNHGLDTYNRQTGNFTHYINNPQNKNSLSNNFIRSICEDKNGVIWIGTNGGGLNKYNRQTNSFKKYTYDPLNPESISDDKVISICQDKEGILWLGTLGGLNKFDPAAEKFTRYKNDPRNNNSLSHNYIFSVFEDSKGYLWIGTTYGLNRYDKKQNVFTRFLTEPGNTYSISNNLVMSIHEDRYGNIWAGTNGGLNKYDRSKGRFYHYTEKDILFNDVIYGILEDSNGCLWLSTNKGLAQFNPATNYVKNYTKEDGLQSNQFSTGAYYKNAKGKMFFGGINGMNEFAPDNIIKNNYIPPVVFTDFQISNKSIKTNGAQFLINSITETKEIQLTYRENVFSFEFAALSYTLPQENEYSYMMEGFDKDWIKSGNRRFVTYTNLDPGNYIFKVRGANNDGVWNTKGISIIIHISPPFWKTWWFIILSAAFILLIIALIISYRMKALLEVERMRFNIAADLHDDLGTHLTEISMLSDTIYHLAGTDGRIEKEMVKKIGGIARQLIDRMSDIVWLINPKRDSLTELFIKIKDNFEEILSYSNILLHFGNLEFLEKIKLPMEYRKNLYLIFKEAMNNSVKYSQCQNIWVEARQDGKKLCITLKDDGKGFNTKETNSGNGLINMQMRAKTVGGLVTIKSRPGDGTEIIFEGKI
jgi:ligand-binding sensor domain-containing protein/signal transduction histidine kinase